jgi:alginate O-acetyltransferase complex protein AlgI
MVFSSIEFLFLFLPLFLLTQTLLPYRNLSYVVLSLLFYFIGGGWYTGIVIGSVVLNFFFGLWIDHSHPIAARRLALATGVASNLSLLFFFKYAGFFAHNISGVATDSWIASIPLPLGISFFSFHAISYLIDIYRRDARAERSFVNLALYMLMFPQLIAGPILRFHTIARQLRRRVVTSRHVYYGLALFCWPTSSQASATHSLPAGKPSAPKQPGSPPSPTRCRSSSTSAAIRTWPSASAGSAASICRATSTIRTSLNRSPSSGAAGT